MQACLKATRLTYLFWNLGIIWYPIPLHTNEWMDEWMDDDRRVGTVLTCILCMYENTFPTVEKY